MSTERERAARYESSKDSLDSWGDAVQPKERRRLASMISVRLSPAEATLVREAADQRGLSVSAFLRNAALHEAQAGFNAAILPQQRVQVSELVTTPEVTILTFPEGASPWLIGDTQEVVA